MASKTKIIGRTTELDQLKRVIGLNRNLLIEGPVGVGKTFLVQQILSELKRKFERVDGDTRYTEQKLTGWFDPPVVLKKGYTESAFIEGPLVAAMTQGKILFINELNRMPEAVQNILLPAMDERRITLPKIGEVEAKAGFCVVATQNPKEFTATHALSEALLDRFEMIRLEYQSQEEELSILKQEVSSKIKSDDLERMVNLVRATRNHSSIKRGASIRAAIAIAKLLESGLDFQSAALMALPSRIELVSSDEDISAIILDLISNDQFPALSEKKKELKPKSRLEGPALKVAPVFFPPELAEQQEFQDMEGAAGDQTSKLMRQLYFERMGRPQSSEPADKKLVSLVLEHAKKVIAHPSRPQLIKKDVFSRVPFGEIDLEDTLEETPLLSEITPDTLKVELTEEKLFTCVAMIDASSSMSGDKHLLASVAVAVLLFEIQSRDASVITFSSKAQVIKKLSVEESIQTTILNFLKSQPRGFTNIAKGLEEGINQFKRFGKGKARVGLIATDGRSTEGQDPSEIAKHFDFLVVLHLHGPGSHLESSQAMAAEGNGICLEVENFSQLPKKIYEAVRVLARR